MLYRTVFTDIQRMKLLSAPMAALSHEALRRLIARFGGCDEYYTEMIHAASFINGGPYEPYYSRCAPEPEKIVWQLTGADSDKLVRCAEMLMNEKDAASVIGIDINMGCPAPEIYRQGAGIAWMSKPLKEVETMLRTLKCVCGTKRLSVKIRLGEENFTLQGLFDFADMLCSGGAQRITLHPRTRKESYARPLKRKYVQLLAEFLKPRYPGISVAGNGAIDGAESLSAFAASCPDADAFMIGRSAVQKPWIFALLKAEPDMQSGNGGTNGAVRGAPGAIDFFKNNYTQIDLLDIAEHFIIDLEECQPADFWKTRAQRFFAYFCNNFQFGNYLKAQLMKQKDHKAMFDRFKKYFKEMPKERILDINGYSYSQS